MVLLDTHIALWLLAGEQRLTEAPAYRYLEDASHRGTLRLAAISLYELARLLEEGTVTFDIPFTDVIAALLETPGLQLAPIDERVASESLALEATFPGDDIDRVICATARALRGSLLTANQSLIDYAQDGSIRVIPVG